MGPTAEDRDILLRWKRNSERRESKRPGVGGRTHQEFEYGGRTRGKRIKILEKVQESPSSIMIIRRNQEIIIQC